MEEAQDWYLHEDLTNLFLLEDSELIYEPLFLDVVVDPEEGRQEQVPPITPLEEPKADPKPDAQYNCHLCSKSFRFKSRLQRHLTTHQVLHCVWKSTKKISLSLLRVALLWKPLVIRFCPLKILSDSFRVFYTVNTQNLKESERIYKGQKRFTKGFFEIDIARFARKNEIFLVGFKQCAYTNTS